MTKTADLNMENDGRNYGVLQNNSMMRAQYIPRSHLYKTTR